MEAPAQTQPAGQTTRKKKVKREPKPGDGHECTEGTNNRKLKTRWEKRKEKKREESMQTRNKPHRTSVPATPKRPAHNIVHFWRRSATVVVHIINYSGHWVSSDTLYHWLVPYEHVGYLKPNEKIKSSNANHPIHNLLRPGETPVEWTEQDGEGRMLVEMIKNGHEGGDEDDEGDDDDSDDDDDEEEEEEVVDAERGDIEEDIRTGVGSSPDETEERVGTTSTEGSEGDHHAQTDAEISPNKRVGSSGDEVQVSSEDPDQQTPRKHRAPPTVGPYDAPRPDVELHPNFLIIDARRPDEYDESHIHGAINIHYTPPRLMSKHRRQVTLPNWVTKDTLIITYCAVGLRSGLLALYLKKQGYVFVRILSGGYYKWVNEERPIYRNPDELVNKVIIQHHLAGIMLRDDAKLKLSRKERRERKQQIKNHKKAKKKNYCHQRTGTEIDH